MEIHRFLSKINDFLNDLKKSRYHNKNHCQQRIIITNNIKERTDDYTDYYNKLLLFNMQENDALIILDAHDFSKYYDNLLDFVTFDNNCYNGASSLPNLAFNKVKGITDFNHIK